MRLDVVDPQDRCAPLERGATILRVHDVRPTVDALTVAAAVA